MSKVKVTAGRRGGEGIYVDGKYVDASDDTHISTFTDVMRVCYRRVPIVNSKPYVDNSVVVSNQRYTVR